MWPVQCAGMQSLFAPSPVHLERSRRAFFEARAEAYGPLRKSRNSTEWYKFELQIVLKVRKVKVLSSDSRPCFYWIIVADLMCLINLMLKL